MNKKNVCPKNQIALYKTGLLLIQESNYDHKYSYKGINTFIKRLGIFTSLPPSLIA